LGVGGCLGSLGVCGLVSGKGVEENG